MGKSILAILIGTSISFFTATLPDAKVGKKYSEEISVKNAKGPCTFVVHHSPLPLGLSSVPHPKECYLTISGTPKKAGDFEFSVRITDSADQYVGRGFEIKVGK